MSEAGESSALAYRGACFGMDQEPSQSCKRRRLSRAGALPASDPWFPSFGCPRFDASPPEEEGDVAVLEVQRDLQRRRRKSRVTQEQSARLREELAALLRQERESEAAVQQSLVQQIVGGHDEQPPVGADDSLTPRPPSS